MDRDELFAAVIGASPSPGQVVYLERRGDDYGWELVDEAGSMIGARPERAAADVWIYYAGNWPEGDEDRIRAVIDDLLAEMESMAGGDDRCRWPLASPWPEDPTMTALDASERPWPLGH